MKHNCFLWERMSTYIIYLPATLHWSLASQKYQHHYFYGVKVETPPPKTAQLQGHFVVRKHCLLMACICIFIHDTHSTNHWLPGSAFYDVWWAKGVFNYLISLSSISNSLPFVFLNFSVSGEILDMCSCQVATWVPFLTWQYFLTLKFGAIKARSIW